jgi:hypothetical protein
MTKTYENAAMFIRWAILSVFALIIVLPALISVSYYI